MDTYIRLQTLACGAMLVAPEGEIDLYTAPLLRQELDGALSAAPRAVIVDLSGTTFFDSSGLSTLARADHVARRSELRLCVVGAHGPVARILEISQLTQVLSCYPDVETALADRVPPVTGS
ncbi:MAG TPA: STAS domain-containing protein [Marmoricola sp.]|jgi:anti-sigma B factor antagonist